MDWLLTAPADASPTHSREEVAGHARHADLFVNAFAHRCRVSVCSVAPDSRAWSGWHGRPGVWLLKCPAAQNVMQVDGSVAHKRTPSAPRLNHHHHHQRDKMLLRSILCGGGLERIPTWKNQRGGCSLPFLWGC